METSSFSTIIQNVAIGYPALLFALVIHEFAHAWMASRFGDQTAAYSGRLTLNPSVHMDLFGSIIFPLVTLATGSPYVFGWAKPVPVDSTQFSNFRKGQFWVSSAGILANFLTGFLCAFLYIAVASQMPEAFGYKPAMMRFLEALMLTSFSLGVFNLLPVPPLDGSNIIVSFLSYNASRKYFEFQQYAGVLLLFLMFSGALKILSYPILMMANVSINLAASVFGLAL